MKGYLKILKIFLYKAFKKFGVAQMKGKKI